MSQETFEEFWDRMISQIDIKETLMSTWRERNSPYYDAFVSSPRLDPRDYKHTPGITTDMDQVMHEKRGVVEDGAEKTAQAKVKSDAAKKDIAKTNTGKIPTKKEVK